MANLEFNVPVVFSPRAGGGTRFGILTVSVPTVPESEAPVVLELEDTQLRARFRYRLHDGRLWTRARKPLGFGYLSRIALENPVFTGPGRDIPTEDVDAHPIAVPLKRRSGWHDRPFDRGAVRLAEFRTARDGISALFARCVVIGDWLFAPTPGPVLEAFEDGAGVHVLTYRHLDDAAAESIVARMDAVYDSLDAEAAREDLMSVGSAGVAFAGNAPVPLIDPSALPGRDPVPVLAERIGWELLRHFASSAIDRLPVDAVAALADIETGLKSRWGRATDGTRYPGGWPDEGFRAGDPEPLALAIGAVLTRCDGIVSKVPLRRWRRMAARIERSATADMFGIDESFEDGA